MTDPRIMRALGLPEDATDEQIAERLRALAGLPPGTTDAALWARFLAAVDLAGRVGRGLREDDAELANGVVSSSIAPPRHAGEQRFGGVAWDREIGLGRYMSDEWLRGFVCDTIVPLVEDIGM
jgi:hypothetical protein